MAFFKQETKSEVKDKIHSKHQRAHVKRAVIHLCHKDKELSLIHSPPEVGRGIEIGHSVSPPAGRTPA